MPEVSEGVVRAEWLSRVAVPMFLEAVGFGGHAAFFRDAPSVTEKNLITRRVLHGRLQKVRDIEQDLYMSILLEQAKLPAAVRLTGPRWSDVVPPKIYQEATASHLPFGKASVGWQLFLIIHRCCVLLALRNNWEIPQMSLNLTDEAVSLLEDALV